jgi:hypothetical protein
MTSFAIVDAKPWHCGRMIRLLRAEHALALAAIGLDGHRELRRRFDESPSFRRAWLIDGNLAALGGVTGTALSTSGVVWLALARPALGYPRAVVREARRQIDAMMAMRRTLIATILDGDETSRRFAAFMGFHAAPWPHGAATRYGRREVLRRFDDEEAERVEIGTGSAVVARYTGREA